MQYGFNRRWLALGTVAWMDHPLIEVFEQPLSERYRLFLRLEQLFARIDHHLAGDSIWDTHAAIATILEMLQTISRGDTKLELIKELERQRTALAKFNERDGERLDRSRLEDVLNGQEQLLASLHERPGALGQELRDNELLNQLQQRSTAGGKPGIIEMPGYQRWLQRSASMRHDTLETWLKPLRPARQAIDRCLALIRDSVEWEALTANGGFYEQVLPAGHSIALLRVRLPDDDAPWFPEISAGRQRFTIRFFEQETPAERARQISRDIPFELARCGM